MDDDQGFEEDKTPLPVAASSLPPPSLPRRHAARVGSLVMPVVWLGVVALGATGSSYGFKLLGEQLINHGAEPPPRQVLVPLAAGVAAVAPPPAPLAHVPAAPHCCAGVASRSE
jgi:hypothetical protein